MQGLNQKFELLRDVFDMLTPRQNFAAGFVAGLAEKVYLGASRAAMVKPSNTDLAWVRPVANRVADCYGLQIFFIERTGKTEIWLIRSSTDLCLLAEGPNDNLLRATLCGVAFEYYDRRYPLDSDANLSSK